MKNVKLESEGAFATITLNRPQKLNSLTIDLMRELRDCIDLVRASEETRVLFLTGAGRSFCSGIDLNLLASSRESLPMEHLREMILEWQATLTALEGLPQPTLAVINGLAYGGAIELALCCDFRFASSKAVFGLPEVKLGILPDLGGIPRLVRTVGLQRAKEIILRSRNFSAMEALRLGLVTRVSEPGDLMGQAQQWAESLSRLPRSALSEAKRLINAAGEQTLEQSLAASLTAQLELLANPEFGLALKTALEQHESIPAG